jgi:hypothetical protein
MKTQHHQSGQGKVKTDGLDCIYTTEPEYQDYIVELAKEVFTRHGAHRFESKCLRFVDNSRLHNRFLLYNLRVDVI